MVRSCTARQTALANTFARLWAAVQASARPERSRIRPISSAAERTTMLVRHLQASMVRLVRLTTRSPIPLSTSRWCRPSSAAIASGGEAVAIGGGAYASGLSSLAIGAGARAQFADSMALGSNSVTSAVNTISVGSKGAERRIMNVANGVANTDAGNVRPIERAASYGVAAFGAIEWSEVDASGRPAAVGRLGIAGQLHRCKLEHHGGCTRCIDR